MIEKMTLLITVSVAFLVCTLFFSSSAYAEKPAWIENKMAQKSEIRQQKLIQIQEKVEEREEKLEKIKMELEQKRASRSAALEQIRIRNIRRYYGLMTARISATIERLQILISRIESRLDKINDTDKPGNISEIQLQIEGAKELLEESSQLLESTNSMLEEVLSSDDPKLAFTVVKENLLDIKNNLKEVHDILVKLIGDLSGLRVGQSNSSITPGVTQSPTLTPVPSVGVSTNET